MSLHRSVNVNISSRQIILVMMCCIGAGIFLPAIGISPPPLFIVKPGEVTIYSYQPTVSEEIALLTKQKSKKDLSPLEFERIRRKLEAANNDLLAGLFKEQESGTSTIVTPPAILRPELPELSYSLPYNSDSASVPRFFMARLPDFSALTPNTKKEKFTQIVLPLILYENERIRRQNEEIRQAYESANRDILDEYAHIYKLKNVEELSIDTLYQKLVMRVQPVPVGLALSQAAVESGWGSSRFALEGNALFGQWVFDKRFGLKAKASNAIVRRFPDLSSSVRSYMRNLNTHRAYEGFRQERLELSVSGEPLKAKQLLYHLKAYAEIKGEYVQTLKSVMNTNKFDALSAAQLESS